MEWIRTAAAGWSGYIDNGKLMVLFLGVLLFLWYHSDSKKDRRILEKKLVRFAVLTAGLVICPVTAALLLQYQTRFYDYEWLWSIVPVTLLIAYGGTLWITQYWSKWAEKSRIQPVLWLAFGLVVMLLCGNIGGYFCKGTHTDQQTNTISSEKAALLMDELSQDGKNKDICLWAPRQVMESVRALSGEIKLLYGRNMWEEALGAYSYDTYSSDLVQLYKWMEEFALTEAENNGATIGTTDYAVQESIAGKMHENGSKQQEVVYYLNLAKEHGVNVILLPDNRSKQWMEALVKELELSDGVRQAELVQLEHYFLLRL